MRNFTSSFGRRQFSLLNAKSVRYSTPCFTHAFTVARTASSPRLCPATRGRKRCFAQRPLPSMMIAMCRGTPCASGMVSVELVCASTSDRHEVRFFRLEGLVDLGDVAVGEFLDVVLGAALLVLRDLLLLEQVFQVLYCVAAHVAYCDAAV